MGVIASEGLRRAAAVAAMVGAISLVFVCDLCIEVLAGKTFPPVLGSARPPIARQECYYRGFRLAKYPYENGKWRVCLSGVTERAGRPVS